MNRERAEATMRFAGFEYKRDAGELWLRGERVLLQEQPLKLLGLLLEKPGKVVSRERLREKLLSSSQR